MPVKPLWSRFVGDRPYPFTTEVSVRFAETDAQGIVHNSVYLVWFELARVEYLVGREGERLADGTTRHATVDARTLRPTRVPEWLVAAIARAETDASSS